MENDKKSEEEEKGFVVRDKRFSAPKEEKEEPQIKEEPKVEGAPEQDASAQGPLPEIDFTNFVLSLSTSALIQLGEIQDPFTQKLAKNLPLAKQTIDLIGMLKEKTKGNLSAEEEKVVEYILYDLRMRFVKAAG
jgi:hypothetical protein